MNSMPSHRPTRRLAALVTALILLLPALSVFGQALSPVTFSLAYTDSQGQPLQVDAVAVPYEGYPTSYWLYLDPQAQADPEASLIILDIYDQYPGGFSTPNGTLIDHLYFSDAGLDLTTEPLEVQALGLNGETLATYFLYISLAGPQPDPPSEEIKPATLFIHYVDQDNQEFASEQRTLDPGTHPVAPDPGKVPEGYTLTGDSQFSVTVDAGGANPSDITFHYHYQPVIQPASITIRYVDQNGAEFASEQRVLPAGQHIVTPDASRVPGDYSLTGPADYFVEVTESGANPSDITFNYQKAIQPATITIRYVDQNGAEFASEQRVLPAGQHIVTPDASRVPGDYSLTGPADYFVEVTESGANPSDITFNYQKAIQPAAITIHYVDQNGAEFASEQRVLPAGQHIVTPDASRVPGDYSLTGPADYFVEVTESGANPSDITFNYQKAIQPATITIHYVDQNNQEFASEQRTLNPGTHPVTPDPVKVPEGYSLTGDSQFSVTVDADGANPSDITFTYHYQAVIQPAAITIHYVDQNNQEFASEQRELPAGQHIVTPDASRVPGDYSLTGQGEAIVEVTESGVNPSDITFTYHYQAEVQPATLTIYFLNDKGQTVASSRTQTLAPGEHIIEPWPTDLQPDYVLTGDAHFTVTVDERGAVPSEITFVYELKPAVSQEVEITIYYVDQNGVPVASEDSLSLGEGVHQISPSPRDLKEGYTLLDEATKPVSVSNNQASPASLTFLYSLATPTPTEEPTPTPAPAPKVALVPVNYVNEAGVLLYTETVPAKEGEQTLIAANLSLVDSAVYELTGAAQQTVTVDANGAASPAEVDFVFRDISIKTATLRVHYRDEAGNPLSASQEMALEPGAHPVTAPETINGLVLQGERTVNVTVSATGVLSQAEVIFTYLKPATATPVPTATPEPTTIPFDITTEDKYAYPNNDNINFRNTPEVKDGNVISTVSRQDLAHLIGSLKNRAGEDWYLAEIKGQQGFLKANVVRVLSFEEAAALLGFTPSPAPTATPGLPDIPDGAVIDRWGEVTAAGGVNLRSSTSTAGSSRIGTLDRGERFWVYEQQTVDGEVWYNITTAGGKDGFLVARYARLYSQEESDRYQATLASPMPERDTPTPTAAASTPTPTPTPTPSPSPTTQVTATPVPYHGYALTIHQAALRSGVSQQDESILATLSPGTLVYIWGQTYVGSEGWNSVDALALTQSGYLPDSALRRISEQEAAPYLEQLKPQATPSPTPTQRPQQVSGYAITLGDHVPMRAYADTNAQILDVLQNSAVVHVQGQEYVAGDTWHLIQFGAGYGFVRADQLRMLSAAETQAYLESLRTPTPTPPAATLPPVTLDSPSSYGYVTANSVRLRRGPSTSTDSLKMMDKNAFALVYGSQQQSDGLWYHINQGGTEGYVMSSYFKVLPMGQLSSYLQSPEYLSTNTTVTSPNVQPGQITSVEDFNSSVWQNPTLLNPSYEPFNPLGTPTPPVEAIATPGTSPSEAPDLEPLPTFMVLETEAPQKADSSFPIGWVAVGLIALLGGGGYYAYHLYNQNQKRAAQRAAQRRQQAAQQSGSPQARPAQPQQAQSPYAPPRSGQQAQQPGATAPYRPGATPPTGQTGAPSQNTTAYRPGATPPTGQTGVPPQGTTAYRPGATPPTGQTGAPSQNTTAYRPGTTPPTGQTGTPSQNTTAYRPGSAQAGQMPPTAPPQSTTAYRPGATPPQAGQQPGTQAPPAQTQASQRPAAPSPDQDAAKGSAGADPKNTPQSSGSKQAEETRRRRSDRHSNS